MLAAKIYFNTRGLPIQPVAQTRITVALFSWFMVFKEQTQMDNISLSVLMDKKFGCGKILIVS